MAEASGNCNLDDFKRYNVKDLRKYVSDRGLSSSAKRKDELVALAYAACVQKLPVQSNRLEEVATDYQSLLNISIDNTVVSLPDPQQLQDGWINEREGVKYWPPCSYMDIAEYLSLKDAKELLSRIRTDYKEGKAFSYFASICSWVKEAEYHPLTQSSDTCFLRSECVPSQNVRGIPHKMWVAVNKMTGKVLSAYCSCFAGLSGTCNHVSALLFKMDYAWQEGLTDSRPKACTSQENKWLSPNLRGVEPMRARDMVFAKPHYGRRGVPSRIPSATWRGLNLQCSSNLDDLVSALYPEHMSAAAFQLLHPTTSVEVTYHPADDMNVCQEEECLAFEVQESDTGREVERSGALVEEQSSGILHVDELTLTVGREEECISSLVPMPVLELARRYHSGETLFHSLRSYSRYECELIEGATRGQAECPEWHRQKKGRISASMAHKVLTKCRKLDNANWNNESVDCSNLIRTIISNEKRDLAGVPSIKYGRDNEESGVRAYLESQQVAHLDLVVTECGLFVDRNYVYMCASPDRLVECSCCGCGLLEVKCPITSIDCHPSQAKLNYLIEVDGHWQLKRGSLYYTQVQLQMFITKRSWCDFFVYSSIGHVLHRVMLDRDFCTELYAACEKFYRMFVVDALVTQGSG